MFKTQTYKQKFSILLISKLTKGFRMQQICCTKMLDCNNVYFKRPIVKMTSEILLLNQLDSKYFNFFITEENKMYVIIIK